MTTNDIIAKNLAAHSAALKRTIVKRAKPFAKYEREERIEQQGTGRILVGSPKVTVHHHVKAAPSTPATRQQAEDRTKRLTQAEINDIAKARAENYAQHRNAPQPVPLRKATELPFDAWMVRIQTGPTATVYITTDPLAGGNARFAASMDYARPWRATLNYDRLVAKLADAEKVIEPDTELDAKGKTVTLTNDQIASRRSAKRLATFKSLTVPTKLPKGVSVVVPKVAP